MGWNGTGRDGTGRGCRGRHFCRRRDSLPLPVSSGQARCSRVVLRMFRLFLYAIRMRFAPDFFLLGLEILLACASGRH